MRYMAEATHGENVELLSKLYCHTIEIYLSNHTGPGPLALFIGSVV